jgi:hypothetical protein
MKVIVIAQSESAVYYSLSTAHMIYIYGSMKVIVIAHSESVLQPEYSSHGLYIWSNERTGIHNQKFVKIDSTYHLDLPHVE